MPGVMRYKLTSADGMQTYELRLGTLLVVGRAPTSDIAIFDPTISRRHAEVQIDESGVHVRDLGSSNGTFLNGNRLENGQPATVSLYVWPADDPNAQPQIVPVKDIGNFKFFQDRLALTIAVVPQGTEVPRPPSVPELDKLTDVAGATTTTAGSGATGATGSTDTTAPTTSTTAAGTK